VRSDRAVLFDLDGVIVDSREHHMTAWDAWARVRAPDAPAGYFIDSFGLRNDAIIGSLFPAASIDEIQALAAEKEALFRASAEGRLIALPGVLDLLGWLGERAIPRAVVTSTPRANLDFVMRAIDLGGHFQALVAGEDTDRGKPDPEGYLRASAQLGIPARRCVVIEDVPAGIEAAKAGGMRAVGVTTTRRAEELRAADLIVDTLADARVREFIEQA